MSVHCLFFVPGQKQPCQVLQALGVNKVQEKTALRLQARFCQSGSFIACPIFCRVEQRLVEANHLRCGMHECQQLLDDGHRPLPDTAPASAEAKVAAARRS